MLYFYQTEWAYETIHSFERTVSLQSNTPKTRWQPLLRLLSLSLFIAACLCYNGCVSMLRRGIPTHKTYLLFYKQRRCQLPNRQRLCFPLSLVLAVIDEK